MKARLELRVGTATEDVAVFEGGDLHGVLAEADAWLAARIAAQKQATPHRGD